MTRDEKLDALMSHIRDNPHGVAYVAGYLEGIVRSHLPDEELDKVLFPLTAGKLSEDQLEIGL